MVLSHDLVRSQVALEQSRSISGSAAVKSMTPAFRHTLKGWVLCFDARDSVGPSQNAMLLPRKSVLIQTSFADHWRFPHFAVVQARICRPTIQ